MPRERCRSCQGRGYTLRCDYCGERESTGVEERQCFDCGVNHVAHSKCHARESRCRANPTCSLCANVLESPPVTEPFYRCSHRFHRSCPISEATVKTCPVCRAQQSNPDECDLCGATNQSCSLASTPYNSQHNFHETCLLAELVEGEPLVKKLSLSGAFEAIDCASCGKPD
jgi:hypothetical protein